MIGYFPNPYENEAMYSIVARYGFHMGINSKHIISEDLFGFRITGMYPEYVNNIAILPSRINHFCEGYTHYLHMFMNGQKKINMKVFLSSGLQRTDAHRFYEDRMNYDKASYVFKTSLK